MFDHFTDRYGMEYPKGSADGSDCFDGLPNCGCKLDPRYRTDDKELNELLNKPLTEIEIAEVITFLSASVLGKFGKIMAERVRRLAFQLDQMKWRYPERKDDKT